MTIKALSARGATRSEIARLLGVTEGAVRHHARRMASGAVDGRSRQLSKADAVAAAIAHWRASRSESGVNLAALHDWLCREHGYRRYAALMKFHVDACPPRAPQAKGKIERRVRDHRGALDPSGLVFRDLAELQAWTDAEVAARARTRRCPATGTSVAEAWAEERRLLTPLPETAPEPFDVVVARVVGRDGLVSFEGRRYEPCRSAMSATPSRSAASPARWSR